MSKKELPKNNTTLTFLETFWLGIRNMFLWLWNLIKGVLVVVEKTLKIVAIFLVSISASILFLTGSFYLFTNTFDLKNSPTFQEARERMATIYLLHLEDDLRGLEEDLEEWEKVREERIEDLELKLEES